MAGKSYKKEKGFTLVELAIVLLVIGILTSIAVPQYLGLNRRSRIRAIMQSCSSAKSELHHWMLTISSKNSQVVDFNGDGVLDASDDTARPVNVAAIPAIWNALHTQGNNWEALTPFFPETDLYNSTAAAGSGQISITCAGKSCLIRGFTDRADDGPVCNDWLSID